MTNEDRIKICDIIAKVGLSIFTIGVVGKSIANAFGQMKAREKKRDIRPADARSQESPPETEEEEKTPASD